jgi:hypothetical protein
MSFTNARRSAPVRLTLLAGMLALAAAGAHAQSPVMVGTLGNFDVINNTGQETHGFEIELEGISSQDIYRIFGFWGAQGNVIRYGAGTAVDFPGGVYVRWKSPWDAAAQRFTQATPIPVSMKVAPGESCWTLGMGAAYYAAGCEHFGISAYRNATRVTYRWLVADPQTPGNLVPSTALVPLPPPVWTVVPPPAQQPAAAPVVVAEVEAAEAPEPWRYGDAQWVKVYKTEHAREVELEELMGGDPVVPQEAGQVETEWTLLQQDPVNGGGGNQRRRGKLANQGDLRAGIHAVVRRYEYYAYSGAYDPVSHEAVCAGDGSCNTPQPGELGDAIGVQNVAVNLNVPSLTVTLAGTGAVTSSDRAIDCGRNCVATYAAGSTVTLTASPNKSTFAGWSGACTGAQPSCTVTVRDAENVTATFVTQQQLAVSRKGAGSVAGPSVGIACGNACTASVPQGTVVTLRATPDAGKQFVNWSGDCSGTSPVCSLSVNKGGAKAQANFSK